MRLGLGQGVLSDILSLDTGYFCCHLVSPGVDDDGAEGVDGDRGGDGAAGGQLVQVVTQRDRLQLRERVRTWGGDIISSLTLPLHQRIVSFIPFSNFSHCCLQCKPVEPDVVHL